MSKATESLSKLDVPKSQKRKGPIWKGPEEDGITFSLLCKFLVCRERFRCLVVEGLRPKDEFNHRMEVGSMWHVCEEALAKNQKGFPWELHLKTYANKISAKYRLQQEEISKWYEIIKIMFPIYVQYWKSHPDTINRTPLLQEQVFDVPYKLPSGRIVRLRGKWDSVDLISDGKDKGIYLQENKTKSEIDEEGIRRQLTFDLQTMMYLIALDEAKTVIDFERGSAIQHALEEVSIRGVRYNVIKRPRQYQGKKESKEDFYKRLEGIVKDEPGEFFARWKVEIRPEAIEFFRKRCLDPILENLCEWWEWVSRKGDPFISSSPETDPQFVHWVSPFGVYNSLLEGGGTSYDSYIMTGGEFGLSHTDNLFGELT